MQNVILTYDGSFDGFLSAVFYSFEYKLKSVIIITAEKYQEQLFSSEKNIITEKEKANRVWKALVKKCGKLDATGLYYSFLSELDNVETILLKVIKYIFASSENIMKDYGNPEVLQLSKIKKMVSREKHRMEAFVRFRLTKDAIYFANIEPDFNVLPLIQKHFKNRFADQKWIIYDLKRNYGLYYNLSSVEIITLDFSEKIRTETTIEHFAAIELEFQQLWKDYFKSTNIESRKNMKLHIRHVPKRYWKYLSEKIQ